MHAFDWIFSFSTIFLFCIWTFFLTAANSFSFILRFFSLYAVTQILPTVYQICSWPKVWSSKKMGCNVKQLACFFLFSVILLKLTVYHFKYLAQWNHFVKRVFVFCYLAFMSENKVLGFSFLYLPVLYSILSHTHIAMTTTTNWVEVLWLFSVQVYTDLLFYIQSVMWFLHTLLVFFFFFQIPLDYFCTFFQFHLKVFGSFSAYFILG